MCMSALVARWHSRCEQGWKGKGWPRDGWTPDMSDFEAVNRVYAEFFTDPFPARACIQAAALPKGVDVEVDAVARKRENR